jgi:subtilisin family serine protease
MRSKLSQVLVIGALCAVFSTAPFAFAQEPADNSDKALLSPEYGKLLAQATESGKVRVIIGVKAARPRAKKFDLQASKDARAALIAAEPALEVNRNSLDWGIPFVAARVDAATLHRLYSSPLVTSISADHENHLLDASSDALIGAPTVWARGFVGTYETVAILDTGVQSSHPFFGGRVVGEACYSGDGAATTPPLYSNCPGDAASATGSPAGEPCYNYPGYAGCEHGTHVAGDAAGNGFNGGGIGFGGVAIEAPILAVQVFTCYWNGSTCIESAYDSDVISGLNWVYSQSLFTQIAAVNLSLGVSGSDYTSACDSVNPAMTTAFDIVKSQGIAVVVAAGNDAFTDGISYPACISTGVSVAAVDDSDNVASFSDVGPNASLFAPGVNVDSSVPTSSYAYLSGTSMAAPHVTGAWSLLKQQNPSASVDQILTALTTTGKPIAVPGTTRTIPRIQLDLATRPPLSVTLAGTGNGTVTSSPAGISCPGTCSANFNNGMVVTLVATANSGSTFAGWSGACIGTASCSVTVNAVQAVKATFNVVTYGLSVTLAGPGSGKVTSSPSGINCPGTCSANFSNGTVVTLTAAANSGSKLAGWSGSCIGTGSCSVTMSAAQAVNAAFNLSPVVTLSPTSLSFGTVVIGNTSAVQTVTLKNTGAATLTITAIAVTGTNSGDFHETATTCGSSLAVNASCTISVDFKPTASGARSANISITDNASGSPHKVPLSGTGSTAKVAPSSSLNFGSVAIGVTSAAKTVTLTNLGTAALTITGIAITGTNAGDFAQTHTCGSSLAAHASCTLSVTFKPTASGTRTAALSISDSASGSPQKVPLSGTGTTAKLVPTSLNFGSVAIGATSAAKTVTLTNLGSTALTITGKAVTGANAGDFAQTHTCGSSLAAQASCTFSVTFKPTASGTRTAALSSSDNASGSPQKVALTGTGR